MVWKKDPETGKYVSGRFAIRKDVAQYWGERKMGTRVNWVIEIDDSDKHDYGSGEFTLKAAKTKVEEKIAPRLK